MRGSRLPVSGVLLVIVALHARLDQRLVSAETLLLIIIPLPFLHILISSQSIAVSIVSHYRSQRNRIKKIVAVVYLKS